MRIGRRRKRGFLPVVALIFVLFLAAFGFRLFLAWNRPAQVPGREVTVSIPAGATFVDASRLLEDAGVIRSVNSFVLLGKIKGLSGKIQAGELLFRTDMTPVEALEHLATGRAVVYPVTFPEGLTARQVAATLAERGLGDQETFLALTEDRDLARELGLPADRLEGFLFPETYSWPKGMDERDIIVQMVRKFQSVFTDELKKRAGDLDMTELEVVTLASIIEKETGAAGERPLVSAVFHNRLKKGYRLQTDPTVIYGLEDFDGNLTKEHLRTDHPYNTYTRSGLPPGPIANPGEDSIRAALYPAAVDHLYFVARGDGTHVFSDSLEEHNRAVRQYQLGGTL